MPDVAWTALDHLDAELDHLDLLLRRAADRADASLGAVQSHQGIYIAREEVDRLLRAGRRSAAAAGGPWTGESLPGASSPGGPRSEIAMSRARIDAAVTSATAAGSRLPLPRLTRRLGLSPCETQILIACLAPELDHGYDRVFAYLQDDLARRRPSVDLVVSLVSRDRKDEWRSLGLLGPGAPLLARGVLQVVPDPASPSGSSALARLLQVTPSVVAHLLGRAELDSALDGVARVVPARVQERSGQVEQLVRIVERARADRGAGGGGGTGEDPAGVVIQVCGAPGAGRAELARAVPAALRTAHVELACPALPPGPQRAELVAAALRDAWVSGLPLVLLDADALIAPNDGTTREQVLDVALARFPGLVLLTGEQPWPSLTDPAGCTVHRVRRELPDRVQQQALWLRAISAAGVGTPAGPDGPHAQPAGDLTDEPAAGLAPEPAAELAVELADQVRLRPGEIRSVAREVGDAALSLTPPRATRRDWLIAARSRATQRLDGLARRVPATHSWDDLVLEGDRIDVLREICAQVRLRDLVLRDWGMAARTGVARGLSVLFAGPPGTGKTMSAGVIAQELGRELFAIDLSQVVSKYIGETEKNLSRIFESAEDSGAVLLFDEADALFGTRTEISDAHDRYANIETSYLLQRMEEYDGIAVLSTNLRQNLDDAFLRRLRFLVDFPLPDAAQRAEIWARLLGGGVPLGDGVDPARLATRLDVSGGSIRNIALAAAFLAAAEGTPVRAEHLDRAARREYEKLGKLWREPNGRRPVAARGTAGAA